MRRIVSILLVALFWAGPVSALLPASADTQLPACCRRHGAHHCAMTSASSVQPFTAGTFAAPERCPFYRRSGPATAPTFTPAAQSALAELPQAPVTFAAARAAVLHRARTQASRGPPLVS